MQTKSNCFLCNTECPKEGDSSGRDIDYYFCPVCGNYGITDDVELEMKSDKHKYSSLVKERNLRGLGRIIITEGVEGDIEGIPCMKMASLLSLYPTSVNEILDRALINLGRSIKYPSDKIKIDQNSTALLFSRNLKDIDYTLQQLSELGYITPIRAFPGEVSVKAKGWEKMDKLSSPPGAMNQAFVAMWFDKTTEKIFEKGIKPAVEHDGKTKCIRVDKTEHNNKICDQIIAEIRKSRYVIADFTGNRGGVYFEAGYALGLGRPVIWIVQKDHLKEVHFDTRQYNYISFEDEMDLFKKLKNRIEVTIPRIN